MEDRKKEASGDMEGLNSEIRNLIYTQSNLSEDIATLSTQIKEKNETIAEKSTGIEVMGYQMKILEEDIRVKMTAVKEKEEDLAERQGMLNARVRAAYINNPINNMLSLLFQSENLIDLMEKIAFIEKLTETDNAVMASITVLVNDLSSQKEELEKSKTSLAERKKSLETEKQAILDARAILDREKKLLDTKIDEVESVEKNKKAAYNGLDAEQKALADEIGDIMVENEAIENQIQALIREAQRKAAEEAARKKAKEDAERKAKGKEAIPVVVPSATGFVRPVPGRVTSPYGNRMHPIYNVLKFHTGIDYSGASGTSVKATKSGTVISRGPLGGYGNMVIIDHGNGISSLYAHLSGFNCVVGQEVSRGQTIGYVGSTGASTGPHLHFEIRVNGMHVNPSNYVN